MARLTDYPHYGSHKDYYNTLEKVVRAWEIEDMLFRVNRVYEAITHGVEEFRKNVEGLTKGLESVFGTITMSSAIESYMKDYKRKIRGREKALKRSQQNSQYIKKRKHGRQQPIWVKRK